MPNTKATFLAIDKFYMIRIMHSDFDRTLYLTILLITSCGVQAGVTS